MTSNNDFVEKTTIYAYIMLLLALFTDSPIATRLSFTSTSSCAKCGTIKNSAKRSCCARGGSWFKNCGDVGDTHFAHTWIEGIESCKDLMTSIPDKLPSRVMPRHVKSVVFPLNKAQSQNSQKNINGSDSVTSDSKGCVGIPNIGVYICVFYIALKWQV